MQKFVSVESLRGWMAWWVVCGHALRLSGTLPWLEPYNLSLLSRADIAVNVFMIVSGFVITHLLISVNEGYPRYLARRFWRLWPLMMLMIGGAALLTPLYAVAYTTQWTGDSAFRIERMRFEAEHFWQYLALHASMFHSAVPEEWLKYSGTALLAPAWSISLEWQFYIIAPILLVLLTRKSPKNLVIFMAIMVLSYAALSRLFAHWIHESFIGLALIYFLAGMTLRLMFRSLTEKKPMPWHAIVLTAIAGIVFAASGYESLRAMAIKFAVIGIIGGVFFGIAAVETGLIATRSRVVHGFSWLVALNPLAVTMGRISYSTYLCHIPVFALVVGYGLSTNPNHTQTDLIAWTLLAVALVVPVSFALYYGFEKPVTAWGNQVIKRHTGAPVRLTPAQAEA